MSVFTGTQPGEVTVTLVNHGNVDPRTLPIPEGLKALYADRISASYLSDLAVEDARSAAQEALLTKGWTPYGEAGNTQDFKQNAVKLSVTIASAPAQNGKTMIQYSTALLSADLPLPENAENVQFSDNPTQLSFASDRSQGDLFAFYRDELVSRGWEPTTNNPVPIESKKFLLFRNTQDDLIEVELKTIEEKTRALVRHQTAAEVAELEESARAEVKRQKAEAEKPKPRIEIELPKGAKEIESSSTQLQFAVGIGEAKAAVAALQKQLIGSGWKVADSTLESMFGNITLQRDGQSLAITYVESGVLAPEITLSAIGAELRAAKK